jgi:hypothetical protein
MNMQTNYPRIWMNQGYKTDSYNADPQDGRASEQRKESSMKQLTSEQFLKDVVAHTLTVKLDSGLYRHLSFRGPHGSNMWFDLITWPGNLTIRGDMGTWIFARIDDMFKFFGSDLERVNPQYWAEKIESESRFGGPSKKFVPEVYRERVIAGLDDHGLEGAARTGVINALNEVLNETEECESELRRAVRQFEHEGFEFSDPWEIDGEDYTYHYLWCLHAIVWGIQQYNAAKAQAPALERTA